MNEKQFIKNLHTTRWLAMIEDILWRAYFLLGHLKTDTVLLHCQSGNDASSVLSSLAQVMSDPYYRTFKGLRVLIYKEWINYQHDFVKKSGLML